MVLVSRALVSVSDKTGLIDFARALAELGVELLSTGGTGAALAAARIPATDVSAVTGFPEMMDGRVKTLHPKIHGGLLALRNDPEHAAAMAAHGIAGIDLLIVNLYPFEEALKRKLGHPEMIENIDIGGPAMIRAAAKNHGYVTVVIEPEDYGFVLKALEEHGGATPLKLREMLAAKAFARTSSYDAAIAGYMARYTGESSLAFGALSGRRVEVLRYGENPHQAATLWASGDARAGVVSAKQLQGKELSYNNINDTDAAFELVAEFDPDRTAAVAIIKHANPCGVAEGTSLVDAYRKALRSDPVSAFGGIVALNRPLDAEAATEIVKIFTEVIIAPDADDEARAIVAAKKNLRLLVTSALPDPTMPGLAFRSVAGGFLIQSRDSGMVDDSDLKVVTKRGPTGGELADLLFAWRVAKHVKSNAIVYARDRATAGVGAGQMSRLDSALIAARKAEEAAKAAGLPESLAKGSVVASDAFFPFADGLIATAEAGATAIIQPGGSVRDQEVIDAADAHGLAMVFTGMRHFRH